MTYIESFCGECCFLESNAPNKAVENATKKAEAWIDSLEASWSRIEVASMSTQYFNAGDYAMYVITMVIKCEDSDIEDDEE